MLKISLQRLAGAVVVLIGLSSSMAFAEENKASSAPTSLNADAQGVMLHGYDPVAYFSEGKPLKGLPSITASYDGVTYQFSSEENKATFLKQPAQYVPAYGGFCSFGVTFKMKADASPELWKIVGGKLYLNGTENDAYATWQKDVAGNIAKADKIWPEIKDTPAETLNSKK